MWYGQVPNAAGGFDSYSRYLDVIAHELTHGVTETRIVWALPSGAARRRKIESDSICREWGTGR
jgi:hypothetical protein